MFGGLCSEEEESMKAEEGEGAVLSFTFKMSFLYF